MGPELRAEQMPEQQTDDQLRPQPQQPIPHVRRVRRRRKRTFKSRIKRVLKNSGADKKLYVVVAGVIGLVVALYLYDLLFAIFPMKVK